MLSGLAYENGELIAETRFGEAIEVGDRVCYEMHSASKNLWAGTVVGISQSGISIVEDGDDTSVLIDPYNVYKDALPDGKTVHE